LGSLQGHRPVAAALTMPAGGFRAFLASATIVGVVAVSIVWMQNVAIAAFFPHLARLTTDFSPAYLKRELRHLHDIPGSSVFLGDSVLWGFDLQPGQTAISLLAARGCACANLAYKLGSPPNYYALARLLGAADVHPKVVVLEINQKVFNPIDDAYKRLHPAVAVLAEPLLAPADRRRLILQSETEVDNVLSSLSLLYAMRTDIRETLYGDSETPTPQRPTAQQFEGSYNLRRLDEKNVGVAFLEKTADVFQQARIPVVAFMTPTNHTLLHEYIDAPAYRRNGLFLKRLLERRGVHVLDLDSAFPTDEFIDNAHLTVNGQRRLAEILAGALSR